MHTQKKFSPLSLQTRSPLTRLRFLHPVPLELRACKKGVETDPATVSKTERTNRPKNTANGVRGKKPRWYLRPGGRATHSAAPDAFGRRSPAVIDRERQKSCTYVR